MAPEVDQRMLAGIIGLLKRTYHGQIIIISQNYRVVQVELKENFNPEELMAPSTGLLDGLGKPEQLQKKIVEALTGLEFGQVILVVKKGHLAQIERLQKVRLSDVQGLGGDGI
ncbi:MAG: YezD family protein [Deltaproteobacteria bacterium]|nr:YezD family protein [Deltaproteobacteria bacterium]